MVGYECSVAGDDQFVREFEKIVHVAQFFTQRVHIALLFSCPL